MLETRTVTRCMLGGGVVNHRLGHGRDLVPLLNSEASVLGCIDGNRKKSI